MAQPRRFRILELEQPEPGDDPVWGQIEQEFQCISQRIVGAGGSCAEGIHGEHDGLRFPDGIRQRHLTLST